jgi:hypothetical protein
VFTGKRGEIAVWSSRTPEFPTADLTDLCVIVYPVCFPEALTVSVGRFITMMPL